MKMTNAFMSPGKFKMMFLQMGRIKMKRTFLYFGIVKLSLEFENTNRMKLKKSLGWCLFTFIESVKSRWELLIESVFHSVSCAKCVNGFPPSILLVGSEGKFVGIFNFCLFLHVKMSVSFGLLVISVLVF